MKSKSLHVLAISQSFGFGPTSMLNRALNLLPDNCKIDGYISEHLEGVIDSKLEVNIVGRELPDLINIDNYDLAIVACDYEIARKLYKSIKKIIIFDMLFWFWPKLDEIIYENILVIAQNFIGVKERVNGTSSVKVVGPIVPDISVQVDEGINTNHAVINLGGFTSPYNGSHQADIYISIILPALKDIVRSFKKVNIIGGKSLLNLLKRINHKLADEIEIVSHKDAILMISKASMYFTAPGLGSIYESFLIKIPTYFIPPTNLTQHLQLKYIIDNISYPWRPDFDYDNLLGNEEEYINSLYDFYECNSSVLSLNLRSSIESFINSSEKTKKDVIVSGFEFANKMGGASEKHVKYLMSEYINE